MVITSSMTNYKTRPMSVRTKNWVTRRSRKYLSTTAWWVSESCGFSQSERSFHLAYWSTPHRAWLHTTQIGFPWCYGFVVGWIPSHLLSKCECGKTFSVEHVLSCSKSGFPTLRHNEIQGITASLLTEVCSKVCVELSDQLNSSSANSHEGARLDV